MSLFIGNTAPSKIYVGDTEVSKVFVGDTQVRPVGTVLFDFGDWSNSQWTAIGGNQGTITKTSSSISFYRSGYSNNYLSEYGIDGTKDFLLEINANIPNTTNATHRLGLYNPDTDGQVAGFMTSWNSTDRNKICCQTDSSTTYYREANPGTADYFIKKEGNTLTMGRGGVTKCTVNNYTFPASFYLFENVYNNTLTIYTAKLTYLSSSNVQLKTSAEIISMANAEGYPRANTIAELNGNAGDYYTQLNVDSYIAPSGAFISAFYSTSSYGLRSSANGSVLNEQVNISIPRQPAEYVPYYIGYNNSTWSATQGTYGGGE